VTTIAIQDRFVALLDQHRRILYKVASVYCARREDRADLIQEIVIELWQAFERFDGRASFSTWMHRIAVNVAISFHRGESRRIRDAFPIEDFAMDLAAADRVMEGAGEDLHALQQLIAQLDEINRALILLYLEGYGHDEIAAMIGITSSNVATRINRIKHKLQRDHAAAEALA
jgi:RNA polymerase sigma-70 factor (ECF subfamily)